MAGHLWRFYGVLKQGSFSVLRCLQFNTYRVRTIDMKTSTLINKLDRKCGGNRYGLFRCYCGETFEALMSLVKNGQIKSCGCFRRETASRNFTKHGHTKNKTTTPVYRTWQSMIKRCTCSKSNRFHRYGGRGIKVCQRWMKFENFLQDMGKRPSIDYSIERIDNDRNYEPSNCKWILKSEQALNTRNLKWFSVFKKSDGSFVGKWNNQHQCARDLGIGNTGISMNLHGKLPHYYGFTFKWV